MSFENNLHQEKKYSKANFNGTLNDVYESQQTSQYYPQPILNLSSPMKFSQQQNNQSSIYPNGYRHNFQSKISSDHQDLFEELLVEEQPDDFRIMNAMQSKDYQQGSNANFNFFSAHEENIMREFNQDNIMFDNTLNINHYTINQQQDDEDIEDQGQHNGETNIQQDGMDVETPKNIIRNLNPLFQNDQRESDLQYNNPYQRNNQQLNSQKKIQNSPSSQIAQAPAIEQEDNGSMENPAKKDSEGKQEQKSSSDSTQDSKNGKTQNQGCNCKKSKCLKLYCECFANQGYCSEVCNCSDCGNRINNEDERQKSIVDALNRNPDAFVSKFEQQHRNAEMQQNLTHRKGCNCKKTHCMKKYCECYGAGLKCTIHCKCEGCHNSTPNPNFQTPDKLSEEKIDLNNSQETITEKKKPINKKKKTHPVKTRKSTSHKESSSEQIISSSLDETTVNQQENIQPLKRESIDQEDTLQKNSNNKEFLIKLNLQNINAENDYRNSCKSQANKIEEIQNQQDTPDYMQAQGFSENPNIIMEDLCFKS